MTISSQGQADLQVMMRQWCEEHLGECGLAELEGVAEAVSRLVGQAVMESGLPRKLDRAGYSRSSLRCECGRKAKFVSFRRRWLVSLFGPVESWRAYYHCGGCHSSQVPWDREQGLSGLQWTPRVKQLVAEAVGRLPYGEATGLVRQFYGLHVDVSSAERIIAEVAGRLRQQEQEFIDAYDCAEIIPLVSEAPGRLYVSMDGTSAHLDKAWHEVKTGVIYQARRGEDGLDEVLNPCYVAACEPASEFGQRLYVAAALAGAEVAEQLVVIGDGAEWVWRLADHHFPWATHILDYWHACEHIHELAKSLYGEGNPKGQRWARDHCRWLKERGPGTLLGALKRMKPGTAEARAALARELTYFSNNRHRMSYPQYREQGMMIGSGPVEAACKTVVGTRLKQSGMRWTKQGADHVLAIRTRLLSGQQEQIRTASFAA